MRGTMAAPLAISSHFDLENRMAQQKDIELISRNSMKTLTFDTTLTPISDVNNRHLGWMVSLIDISDRIESEKEKQHYIKQLKQYDQLKSSFFAGISHEFKTIADEALAAIQNIYRIAAAQFSLKK